MASYLSRMIARKIIDFYDDWDPSKSPFLDIDNPYLSFGERILNSRKVFAGFRDHDMGGTRLGLAQWLNPLSILMGHFYYGYVVGIPLVSLFYASRAMPYLIPLTLPTALLYGALVLPLAVVDTVWRGAAYLLGHALWLATMPITLVVAGIQTGVFKERRKQFKAQQRNQRTHHHDNINDIFQRLLHPSQGGQNPDHSFVFLGRARGVAVEPDHRAPQPVPQSAYDLDATL